MSKALIIKDKQYTQWIADLSLRYQRSQIKAASSVNREMLIFYWQLGRDITIIKAESRWGNSFYESLSTDLRRSIPNAKGFSVTNLRYMRRFYEFTQIHPQVEGRFAGFSLDGIHPQVGGESPDPQNQSEENFQLPEKSNDPIFAIPWGHIKLILDKCGTDYKKAYFYIHETLNHNWSRAVLLNWLDTDLFERQGKAITNFSFTLP